ncbi:hypothetical protein BO71DRAFT_485416 [Aspergillus ellipticus CBS 707.79]|uniref:Uncharacterized protein n=1 Tax=Aspergillus ellipticus CBS 707.79 TaxID=1448320 RepID=A0A319DMD6_9EURO|nr:hypothetical protein BO71DRAFT_485416 [Aspergillus ellipticus CBS 707.79]
MDRCLLWHQWHEATEVKQLLLIGTASMIAGMRSAFHAANHVERQRGREEEPTGQQRVYSATSAMRRSQDPGNGFPLHWLHPFRDFETRSRPLKKEMCKHSHGEPHRRWDNRKSANFAAWVSPETANGGSQLNAGRICGPLIVRGSAGGSSQQSVSAPVGY